MDAHFVFSFLHLDLNADGVEDDIQWELSANGAFPWIGGAQQEKQMVFGLEGLC